MSLLDCFCASRTRVESLRPEKQSETSIHQYLVDEPAISWPLPSARAKEVICSTNVSHYELQVEIGNDAGLHPHLFPLERKLWHTHYFMGMHVFLPCHLQLKTGF